jgi:hypothetical protein
VRKPGIPSNPKTPGREGFDGAIKESLETIMGRRDSKVELLPTDATQEQIIAKLNQLIQVLQ